MAEAVDEKTGRFVDVMDPDGNVFRFYEVEFALACAMDGERDAAGIVRWAQDELGMTPREAEVRNVIATLDQLGYLEGAAAARPGELGPGVVVGQRRPEGPGPQVELGGAGSKHVPAGEMPSSPNLSLGAPGTAARGPKGPVEEVPLGAPGRGQVSDVSIDLADQMVVRPDDVKEAVRASKVMQAVDVPPELRDELEAKPTQKAPVLATPIGYGEPPKTEPQRPTPQRMTPRPFDAPQRQTPPPFDAARRTPQPFEAVRPEAARPEPARPEPRPEPAMQKPPVELPRPISPPAAERPVRPPLEKSPIAPPAPRRTSPVLVIALIVVLGAAIAFFVWKFVIDKSNQDGAGDQTSSTTKPAPPPENKPPDQPPPKQVPTAKLALETSPAVDLKPAMTGQLDVIDPARTVKQGDVIAKLNGRAALETEIKNHQSGVKRVNDDVANFTKELDAAKTANKPDAALKAIEDKINGRKKDLTPHEQAIQKLQPQLDKYLVKAPTDGDYKPVAKQGAKITEKDVVATITPPAHLVGTFRTDAAPAVDSLVIVNAKDKKLVCKVAAVDNGVKVACANDPALADATATYGGPAPADAVPTPPDIEMPADGSGSGSGSAAKPAEKPAEKPTEKPAQKPAEKPATPKPAEKPIELKKPPTDKPADKPADPPAPGAGSS